MYFALFRVKKSENRYHLLLMWIFYVTRSVVGCDGNDLHGQTDHSQNRLRSHRFHLPFRWICALSAALVIVCDADDLGYQTEDSDNALRRHADSPAFPAVIRNACLSMYVSPLPVPFPENLERLIGKAADKADDRADSTADGCACRRTDFRAEERADRSENEPPTAPTPATTAPPIPAPVVPPIAAQDAPLAMRLANSFMLPASFPLDFQNVSVLVDRVDDLGYQTENSDNRLRRHIFHLPLLCISFRRISPLQSPPALRRTSQLRSPSQSR